MDQFEILIELKVVKRLLERLADEGACACALYESGRISGGLGSKCSVYSAMDRLDSVMAWIKEKEPGRSG